MPTRGSPAVLAASWHVQTSPSPASALGDASVSWSGIQTPEAWPSTGASGHTLGAASRLQTPEVWSADARATTLHEADMRARLQHVTQAGHVATLPPPPGAALRRHGLWRNLLIQPESNSRSVHLEQRLTQQLWHSQHGPPTQDRAAMDEASALLRALHAVLPLVRVTRPTNTSRNVDMFTRRYGKKLASQLQAAGAMTQEGRLHADTARSVLRLWFLDMARPVTGKDNSFQWIGFHLHSDTEGEAFCEEALRRVLSTDAR